MTQDQRAQTAVFAPQTQSQSNLTIHHVRATMKSTLTTLLFALTCSFSAVAAAESVDYEFPFKEGTAIIYCALAEKNDVLPVEVFNSAFPLWVPNLLEHAQVGRIVRAHLLNKLKSGVFILVRGDNAVNAMENARTINQENHNILVEAARDTGFQVDPNRSEICQVLPIGPELIGPQHSAK
jgi:hypothetical protein